MIFRKWLKQIYYDNSIRTTSSNNMTIVMPKYIKVTLMNWSKHIYYDNSIRKPSSNNMTIVMPKYIKVTLMNLVKTTKL